MKTAYPRIEQLGIPVEKYPGSQNFEYVPFKELERVLKKHGLAEKFHTMFGIQTVCDLGPYPWDVEAVLERIFSGKLIGSQLDWD